MILDSRRYISPARVIRTRGESLRDKLISIRVNSRLFDEFNAIVKSKTRVSTYYGRKFIEYEGKMTYEGGGKYTVSDLLESALEEYVKANKMSK